MVEESATGGVILAVSGLVHHGRVESMANLLKKKSVEL